MGSRVQLQLEDSINSKDASMYNMDLHTHTQPLKHQYLLSLTGCFRHGHVGSGSNVDVRPVWLLGAKAAKPVKRCLAQHVKQHEEGS